MTDDELHDLLHDAVSDVEPGHRLAEIRSATATGTHRTRRGWYAAGSGLLAAAAVVVIALIGTSGGDRDADRQPAGSPTPTPTPTRSLDPNAPITTTPTAIGSTTAHVLTPGDVHVSTMIYDVADAPTGPRLFGELRPSQGDALEDIRQGLMATPDDPDYSTRWPAGSLLSIEASAGTVLVGVSRDAPVGDDLARQQLAYTLQDWSSRHVQVQLTYPDGTSAGAPFDTEPAAKVRGLVNISAPSEGQVVTGSFTAQGVADSFEATVGWRIVDAKGRTVDTYSAMAHESGKLSPWQTTIDVSALPAGTYTFVAMTDDPTGGTEGPGPTSDTRTIVVE